MRVVLFDVDGVLIHSYGHPDAALRRFWNQFMAEDLGIDSTQFQKFFGPAFDAVVAGKTSLVTALDEFLPTVGYRGSTMDVVTYWLERDSHLNYPLLEAIKALRASGTTALYVATNQEPFRALHLWRELRLGHVFNDIFYAARIGALKPDPAFFAYVNARLGPQAEPPLLFDDSPKVIEGAITAGWDAVLYNGIDDFRSHPWIVAHSPSSPSDNLEPPSGA